MPAKKESEIEAQKFISIRKAMEQEKGKVAVRGWVYRERGSNKLKFIGRAFPVSLINAGAGFVIFSTTQNPRLVDKASHDSSPLFLVQGGTGASCREA